MFRLIIALLLFAASLLAVFPIPAKQVWYLAIAVSEFPWVWLIIALLLLTWILIAQHSTLKWPSAIITVAALLLFMLPIIQAYKISRGLEKRLTAAFGSAPFPESQPHRNTPYSAMAMISGIGIPDRPFQTYQYAPGGAEHSLNFYAAALPGKRPCILVVHGGSWKSGNNAELPDVDHYFANAGYQVATMNYRLAGMAPFPAPREDVHSALVWLRQHAASLQIDTQNFVLMGRSAGGQIVLDAAYSLQESGLKGVIAFYGPVNMVFGYKEPHNQLVMKNREVLSAFLGGSPAQVPDQYNSASPFLSAKVHSVPTLLIHGMLDQHVHFAESIMMDRRLEELGVPHMLLGLPWATHGCEYSLNGPSGQLAVFSEEWFLRSVCR